MAEENEKKGIVTFADIREVQPDLSIWKGDITRLKVGAIVNAANSGMTGCYQLAIIVLIIAFIPMQEFSFETIAII